MTEAVHSGILSGVSTRLKQFGISLLVRLLRIAKSLAKGLWWLIVIIVSPLMLVLKVLLKPLAVFLYRQYLKFIAVLKKSSFFQNKVFFIFGNKYFIHVIIVTLTLFVASTNVIQAKKVYDEDFGTQSGLYKIAGEENEFDTEIVEKGLPTSGSTQDFYVNTDGMLVASIPRIDPQAQRLHTIEEELQLMKTSSALASGTVLSTEVGIRSDFTEYKIREGDSVGSLANRFGVTVNTILWANDLTSKSYIKPGDTLSIPPYSGYTVEVKDGDTLQKLAAKHEGDFDATLEALEGNEIIPVGSKIVIADGQPYIPPPPTPVQTAYAGSSGSSANLFQQRNLPAGVTAGNLNWPVGCRNTPSTYYGHGLARDIACPSGTPIYAAEAGTAYIRNSGGYGGGYGNYVDVVHGGGMTTRYAHMSAFNISSGQAVSRGQVIGFVGSTGRSSGPHVHFEVQINGVRQEPLNYIR